MRRNQILFGLIIAGALGIVLIGGAISALQSAIKDNDNVESVSNNPEVPKGSVLVTVQSSNTKELWLERMEQQFNATNPTLEDGSPVFVQVEHTGSPLEQNLEPVLWSPSNNLWIEEQNTEWRDLNRVNLITDTSCPSTISMPVGIAMWKPMAEALGWPNNDITWTQITDLAQNPEGWASVGLPQWGEFRYGHGHPEWSNSGRLSVVAQIYAAKGSTSALTINDITSEATKEALRPIQTSITHYGRRDTFLLDRMVERGASYLHAVTNYEGNVIRWNEEFGARLQFPLVMVYPVDGTFWEDHPMCILDSAPWVTAEQIEGAKLFQHYITQRDQQAQLPETGVRPAVLGVPIDGPNSKLRLENGVIPTITRDSMPVLPYPNADLMPAVVDMWYQVKKPATVVLIIDVSGSMFGEPIINATQGAQQFLDKMQAQDEIITIAFNDQIFPLEPSGLVGDVREDLRVVVGGLIADGGTALYGAVIEGLDIIEAQKAEDLANGEKRTYSIIVLSDGENSASDGITESQMMSRLPDGTESDQEHLYTIAYGEAANQELLTRVANRTNGQFYSSSAQDIAEIYFLISSEF